MPDATLAAQIASSKYPKYRLGDIVINHPCDRREHLAWSVPMRRSCPSSIASRYAELHKGDKCIGHKMRDQEDMGECMAILQALCDDVASFPPMEDALVATLRLGDMIEQNAGRLDGRDLAERGGMFRSRAGEKRILSHRDIIVEANEKALSKVVLLGGGHGAGSRSAQYLKHMLRLIEAAGLECCWFHGECPDVDLAFISNARHIVSGPGGFCFLGQAIAEHRFGATKPQGP
jgi:hypothetical protein